MNHSAFASTDTTDLNCFDPFGMSSFFLDILKDPCEDKKSSDSSKSQVNESYCQCLNTTTKGVVGILRQNRLSKNAEIEKEIEEEAKKRKDKLDHLYRFMNYEVGFQEQKYGLVEKDKQIGCTPKKMAKTVTAATDGQINSAQLAQTSSKHKKMQTFLLRKSTPAQEEKLLKEFERSIPQGASGNLGKRISAFRIILSRKDLSFDEKMSQLDGATKTFNAESASLYKNEETAVLASPYDAVYADSFANADKAAFESFKKDHAKTVKGACLTYEDFKVIDSAPTKDMMKIWSGSTSQQVADSFLASNLTKGNPILNFLHRNPVLAKNITSDKQRQKLAHALQDFAKQNRNVEGAQKIANYGAFMKSTIKTLNAENDMGTLLQCDLLAQNYAAASDKNMSLAKNKAKDQVGLDAIMNNMNVCAVMEENKSKVEIERPSLDEILNANALFSVFHQEGKGSIFSPETDTGYLDFIRNNCEGYAEVEKAEKCSFLISDERCSEKLSQTDSRRQRKAMEKFYKKNKALGDLVAAAHSSTVKMDDDKLADKTDEKKQDKEKVSFYEANVKPFLSNRDIYSTKDVMASSSGSSVGSELARAVESAQENYSAAHAPSQVADYSSPSVSNNAQAAVASTETNSAPAAGVNPGHFVPPYLSNNETAPEAHDYSPEKIKTFEQAAAAVDNIESVPKAQREQVLGKAKEVIEDLEDDRSEAIEDYKKKIAELEHKKDEVASDNTRVASRAPVSSAPVIPSAVNRAPANVSSGFSAPVSSGAALAKLTPGDNKSKAAASYDRALIQANESQSTSVPSLVVESSSQFDFVASPVTTNNLVVGTSLEPSQQLFTEISSNSEAMKNYLAKNLKEIPEGKLVSIKCKGDGCQPQASELLFMISKGPNNKFSIRSVKVGTEVVRQSKYQDLKRATKKI